MKITNANYFKEVAPCTRNELTTKIPVIKIVDPPHKIFLDPLQTVRNSTKQ